MKNLKSHPMYWLYNILLLIYWATLIPMLIYRLIHEEGFYQRIKQSIGFLPDELKEKYPIAMPFGSMPPRSVKS